MIEPETKEAPCNYLSSHWKYEIQATRVSIVISSFCSSHLRTKQRYNAARFINCVVTKECQCASHLHAACSGGRIVSWIIYCWLVWCERKTLFPAGNLRSFTNKRTGWISFVIQTSTILCDNMEQQELLEMASSVGAMHVWFRQFVVEIRSSNRIMKLMMCSNW